MNWLHRSLGLHYGLIIILITVVIKLVFWPLTRASTRSMKRMQELQPQIKALQEKYKDDPQKLSQKQWEFYKKNKVNPLGGCLPMLLQIPVFFGFFGMLRSAIELRGAHFLWIGDLSQPDTIFILPFLGHHISHQPDAVDHGRVAVLAGQHDAAFARHGSRAAEDDEVHAADDGAFHV